MAQFDVHRLGDALVVDCQSDLLEQLASRFVAPLIPLNDAPKIAQRLNPVFEIEDQAYVLLTQAAAAVSRSELGEAVSSLSDRSLEIVSAIDVLVSGV